MTTPGEITRDQQRVQNSRSALCVLWELGIMDPNQIDEARGYINDGSTCIDVVIAGKSYCIYGLSQMIAHGRIIGVEDDEFDEYRFSTLVSFIEWLELELRK